MRPFNAGSSPARARADAAANKYINGKKKRNSEGGRMLNRPPHTAAKVRRYFLLPFMLSSIRLASQHYGFYLKYVSTHLDSCECLCAMCAMHVIRLHAKNSVS